MPFDFDFYQPDYIGAFAERKERLLRLKSGKLDVKKLKLYYKDHIADFISDWGVTFDTRNVGDLLRPPYLPFILFKRQREFVEWFLERMNKNEDGICEKSRELGVSWLTIAITCSLCLFNDYLTIGFGSRKEALVDHLDDDKSLFWKARQFINNLPVEFTGSWSVDKDTALLRIIFPDTKSSIIGESGDEIGRGGRARVYVVDEAAFLERPKKIDGALSYTTRCRIDVSSANGTANSFFEKRTKYAGTPQLFTFHWREDPRKDEEWYQKESERLDPVILAQEVDIDYTASVEGILIPNAWVQAAVDAHVKLGFEPEGTARVGLDVADEGGDKNAFVGGKGSVVRHAKQWSGKGIDVVQTTANCAAFCDDFGYRFVSYDADGVGSGVRGAARVLERKITFEPYRGSEGVQQPEREDEYGRLNKDFFQNRKAQAWWRTRKRFERTWQAVTKGIKYEPNQLISLDSSMDLLPHITMQLSQPTFTRNESGKIVVDKMPDGAKSPDLADALVIWSECVGDDTGAAATIDDGLMKLDGKGYDPPAFCEAVYGVAHNVGRPGKDNSGTGITYWALTIEGMLYCLGWDLTEVEGAELERWLLAAHTRLNNESERTRLGNLGIYFSDEGQNGVVAQKSGSHGNTETITGKIVEMDARGQALHVTGHITSVRLCHEVVSKSVEFRGRERNHLMTQVRGFTADTKDVEDMAMLRSFVYGVNIALEQET